MRSRPVVIATRVTERERALIEAAVSVEGTNLATLVRRLLIKGVRDVLAREADAAGGRERPGRG